MYTLFVAEFAQTVMASADAFHWLAYGFGNMLMLTSTYISSVDVPILYSIIAFAVQLFFGWRLWILSKSRILCGIIAIVCHFPRSRLRTREIIFLEFRSPLFNSPEA